MMAARPSICMDSSWHQYTDLSNTIHSHRQEINRLIRLGYLKDHTPLLDCGKRVCGHDQPIPKGRASPTPFGCPALCKVAQIRLEHNEVPRIARILSKYDPSPLAVTIVNPGYWLPPADLPTFNVSGIKQSTVRALRNLEHRADRPVMAVGRVDFDLGMDHDNIVARPHVHIIIAGSDRESIYHRLQPKMDRTRFPNLKAVMVKPVRDIGALRYALKGQLKGLSNGGDVPVSHKFARERTTAAQCSSFQRFLSTVNIGKLMILFGLNRRASIIYPGSDFIETSDYIISHAEAWKISSNSHTRLRSS